MTFGLTEGGKLGDVITHNVILAKPKTEYCVCHWLRAQAMFDVTCSPAFIGEMGFNKTEAAVFSCRLCFLRAFPFISSF